MAMTAMMASIKIALVLFLTPCVVGSRSKVEKNPIRKIVGELEKMQAELETAAEQEKELFDKAMCVCETGERDLQGVIDHSNGEITRLTSKIESETAEKQKLDKDLELHAQDKVDTEKNLEETAALREKENAKFVENEKTTMFSEDQLARAIPLFEKKGAASFMQSSHHQGMMLKKIVQVGNYLNPEKRRAVVSFLEQGQNGRASEPSAAASEIIGMMKAMQDEMKSDLADMRKTETDDQNAFNDMKQNKLDHLGNLMKMLSDKQKRSGELALSLSEDKDALEDTNTELEDATKYLAALMAACEQRRKDRDMRNKMRTEEIAAISEAIKILTDDDALETFKKAVPSASLVQQPQHAMDTWDFLQTASTQKAISRLQLREQQPDDVTKNAGQAAKVVDFMIDNMVETIHDDDVNDEHKKEWCANETTVMHQLESDKKALTEELTKKLEVLENELATLTEEIKTLTMEIEDLDADVFHATEQRKKEHKEFMAEYQNAAVAKGLVKKAAKRLEKFYSPNAAGAALLQHQHRPRGPVPEVVARLSKDVDFDSFVQLNSKTTLRSADGTAVDPIVLPDTPQKYQKSESGGVMGLMNNMISDLESDMREGEVEEKHASKDYVKLMQESADSRAAMVKSLKEKKLVKAEKEETQMQTNQRNDLTIEEVKQLQLYLAQVHTECDFLMRNFENRHNARAGEEVGLKSAESIVTKEDVPTHGEVEAEFKSEETAKDVDKHYPEQDMPVF
jgi:hypothetical protein